MKRLIKFMMIVGVLGIFVGFKTQVNAAVQYETENNDSYAKADTITLGNTIKGNVSDGDEDYYKITAPANGKIALIFQHKYMDENKDWEIVIYQYANGIYNELSNTSINIRDNESIILPFVGAVKGGIYYLRVCDDWNMRGEEYTIQTSFTSSEFYEKEQNDDYYSANNIALNNKYTGTINNGSDVDYYKIVAPVNGKINIYFQHRYKDVIGNWTIKIYQYVNGQYDELSGMDINIRDNENISLPYIGAVKNGVYYLKVEDDWEVTGENYTIQTTFLSSDNYEKEPNNDYYSATNINLNQKYGGNLNNGKDKDYYYFVAPVTGSLCVDFQHTYKDNGLSWEIDVYNYIDGEYKEIDSREVSQNDNNVVNLFDIQVMKGRKYYIIVRRGDVSIGNDAIEGKEYFIKAYMKPKTVKVAKIHLSSPSKKIAAGNKVRLKASVSPSNATNKGINWSSSNQKVAKVNQNGIVTFKKNSGGRSVIITATASDGGGAKASIKLKSMRGEVKKIIIKGKKKVKAGKSRKLRAKVKATRGANTRIKWSSSNTKYATVSAYGKVKAKKAGKGKIVKVTARATDGSGKKKTVNIKIK